MLHPRIASPTRSLFKGEPTEVTSSFDDPYSISMGVLLMRPALHVQSDPPERFTAQIPVLEPCTHKWMVGHAFGDLYCFIFKHAVMWVVY